jgi:hypothetical protein
MKEIIMAGILVQSVDELNEIKNLVSQEIPNYRQAYSDRTSFIMACLSELVYLQFNEAFFKKDDKKVIDRISSLLDESKLKSFMKLYDVFGYDHEEEILKLTKELEILEMKLIRTFDSNGTQAMIISTKTFHALVFRGTEVLSIKDIKADLDAKIIECESGGKIHRGFNDAFSEVHTEIQNYLDNDLTKDKPLFISGHSLGGALATVASKKLSFDQGIAACYTFGAPRVGIEDWMKNIKTPIYRMVNSADPVTMMPPGDGVVSTIAVILDFCRLEGFSKKLLANFGGYYHVGNMRFLTNVDNSNYKSARLLYSVSFLRRMKAYLGNLSSLKSMPGDHSMSVYRKKLKFIAINKNKKGKN